MSSSALAVGGGVGSSWGGGRWSERLLGEMLPGLGFASTGGGLVNLADATWDPVVVFVFPGVDRGVGNDRDPDGLLGSGCSVQARGFRELALDFAAREIEVLGLSSAPVGELQTFALREGLPFALLSDPELRLHECLGIPTYEAAGGQRVYERLSFLARESSIQRVFHPVPIPRRNAADILTLTNHHHQTHH
jgi:peroxiredoxin